MAQSQSIEYQILALLDRIIDVEILLTKQIFIQIERLEVKQHPTERFDSEVFIEHRYQRFGHITQVWSIEFDEFLVRLLGSVELLDVSEGLPTCVCRQDTAKDSLSPD